MSEVRSVSSVQPTAPDPCLWVEIEDGSGIYNTCKSDTEGEWHLEEGLELHKFCPYCGKPISVYSDEEYPDADV